MRPLLPLLLILSACQAHPPRLDLGCDRLVFEPGSELWEATLRRGHALDSALAAAGRGRLVVRAFSRNDSTLIRQPLRVTLEGGATPASTVSGVSGVAAVELEVGLYSVTTRCIGCPRTAVSHAITPGQVDTLGLYLGQARTPCG